MGSFGGVTRLFLLLFLGLFSSLPERILNLLPLALLTTLLLLLLVLKPLLSLVLLISSFFGSFFKCFAVVFLHSLPCFVDLSRRPEYRAAIVLPRWLQRQFNSLVF